jgi:hypothetical protein
VADVIVRLAHHDRPPMHLLLGSDAVHFASLFEADRIASDAAWREVSVSTDFAAPATPPRLPSETPSAATDAIFGGRR